MQIYIKRGSERMGPYSLEEVNRQLGSGLLNPSEQAWHEDSAGWKPLFSIAGVILPGAASASSTPAGLATPVSSMAPVYAGFWIRAVALIIDSLILSFPAAAIWFFFWPDSLTPWSANFLLAIIAAGLLKLFYFAGFWASPMCATPGQKICRIEVVRQDTLERISFGRAVGRFFSMALSSLTIGVGYVMAAFTERKRALHDIVAGTCVVKTL